jgi:hypothetical protein
MVRKTRISPIGAAFSNRHFHLNLMTLNLKIQKSILQVLGLPSLKMQNTLSEYIEFNYLEGEDQPGIKYSALAAQWAFYYKFGCGCGGAGTRNAHLLQAVTLAIAHNDNCIKTE